ncbi:hypothetical protein CAEBREN_31392 [Caenorhabditis brenneri]|uniref:HAT C-terminal dimerisation domain-containing protein n=1 Tax=Caenorhabditis brenneri TaxID=135651 RepID=G0PB77_CAEBE|nr:hypothetical protein CAEBREN_31392 [Caenorhabditis brenneri]
MDSQSDVDELTTFMQEKVTRNTPECPLLYWSNKKDEYPLLSQIALRVYSTVSSETICERAFSAVKRVVRDDRHRLKPAFIEKLMLSYFHANQYK